MKRLIRLKLAIDTVIEDLDLFDLPYKIVGYENYNYETDEDTQMPWCYTIKILNSFIHIVLDEEKYIFYSKLTDTEIITDHIQDIKMWFGKLSQQYHKFRS